MNFVYVTENLINGKKYVGSHCTEDVEDNYLGSGVALGNAFKKYGKENFRRTILEYCDSTIDARKLEEFYIEKLKTLTPIGYNISPTGGTGFGLGRLAEETKRKMSESRRIFYSNINERIKLSIKRKGRKVSEETRKKISESNKDKPKSEEHKESLSLAWKERKIKFPTKQETIDKMRKSMMGKNAKCEYKLIDPDNNVFFTNNLTQFSKEYNLQSSILHKVASGERKHHKGWKCEKLK